MDTEKETYINSINLNGNTDFPYLVLDVTNGHSYPRNPGFLVMHWHEDLQFLYMKHGTVQLKTLDGSLPISAGEAVFINKNVVHQIRQMGECQYSSFIFPDYFLEFYMGGPARAFVDSIVGKECLPFFHFDSETGWSKNVLSMLRKLSELEKEKSDFYVYEVLVLLSEIWLLICKNISMPLEKKKSAAEIRMRKFLNYIEQHYGENLSLGDLAKSANVSKTECLRCFKQSMGTTPYKYLIEYRLLQAAALLTSTDDTVEWIAGKVGFGQASSFGKYFREKTGLSPKEYRKQYMDVQNIDISESRWISESGMTR